jgi:DNA-binding NarL/FixJ family response regulator
MMRRQSCPAPRANARKRTGASRGERWTLSLFTHSLLLRFTDEPELRSGVREALLHAEVVDSLISAKKADEALALVRRVAVETEDAAVVEELEEMASRIEGFVAKQKDVDAYNRAVQHANAGEYAKAERILVGLAENAKDPRLKESATKLLNDVRRAKR